MKSIVFASFSVMSTRTLPARSTITRRGEPLEAGNLLAAFRHVTQETRIRNARLSHELLDHFPRLRLAGGLFFIAQADDLQPLRMPSVVKTRSGQGSPRGKDRTTCPKSPPRRPFP